MLSSPQIATRKAYGQALAKLGRAHDRIIALDGDTKNSTFSDIFRKEHPERFIECYIAEQNMVGAGGAGGHRASHSLGLRSDGYGAGLKSSCSSGQPCWQCQVPAGGQPGESTGIARTQH